MHEQLIAQRIIAEAEKQGTVRRIKVEVGELAEITPEELAAALKGSVDWDVAVQYKESAITCVCGYEGKAHIIDRGHGYCYFDCPECHKKPTVIGGGEIKIVGIECV